MWGRRSACPALCHSESGPLSLSVRECGATWSAGGQTACPLHPTLSQSLSRHCNRSPLRPGCPSPPLLPVWMNAYFFYLLGVGLPCRWIFCQFWLCEEVQCVYLRRHLGSLFTQLLESVCLCLLSNMGHFQAYFLHHFSMLLSLSSRTLMVTVSHLCYFLQVSGALVTFFPTVSVLVNFISSVLF